MHLQERTTFQPLRVLPSLAAAACLAALLAPVAGAFREFRIPAAPDDKLGGIIPVVAPHAKVMLFHDDLGFLLVGEREPKKDGTLALYRVDGRGWPSADPIMLPLPKPPGVSCSYPIGLAFHPKLRQLYVWQDTDAVPPPGDEAVYKSFEHLLIYDLSKPKPELIYRGCQGPQYQIGTYLAGLTIDPKAARLYLPNMRDKDSAMVGYVSLDDKGLPLPEEKDKERDKGDRSRVENIAPVSGWPSGTSFCPVSDDVVLFGGSYGPITWDLKDRRGRINCFYLYPYANHRFHMAVHPTVPVFFCLIAGQQYIYRFEHADGYMTMMPHRYLIDDLIIHSQPLLLPKRNQLAVAGTGKVLFLNLDAKGNILPKREQVAVETITEPPVIACSERWNSVFVPVPKPDKEKK